MTSVLLQLSLDQSKIEYVLSCAPADQWISLSTWLGSKNIGLCARDNYNNPNKLVAGNIYCVASDVVKGSYVLFLVLVTSDWQDKDNPAPHFVNDLSWLAWTTIPAKSVNLSIPLV